MRIARVTAVGMRVEADWAQRGRDLRERGGPGTSDELRLAHLSETERLLAFAEFDYVSNQDADDYRCFDAFANAD